MQARIFHQSNIVDETRQQPKSRIKTLFKLREGGKTGFSNCFKILLKIYTKFS